MIAYTANPTAMKIEAIPNREEPCSQPLPQQNAPHFIK